MDSEALSPFDIYTLIRDAEVGTQLERLFRALTFLLHQWRSFGLAEDQKKLVRKGRNGKADQGRITVIEFDKFVNIACRLWTKLFQATGAKFIDRVEELDDDTKQQIVRFKPPVDEIPGLHGPGEARTAEDGNKVVYVVAMLKMLADEGIPYFTFQTRHNLQSSASETTEKTEPELWDPASHDSQIETVQEFDEITRTWGLGESALVEPGIRVTDDAHFWTGFTDKEIAFVRDLANALRHLGPTEIRALGTHKDSASTVEEVRRELRWAKKHIESIVTQLSEGQVTMKSGQRLHMSIDEALRKSTSNKDDYTSAYGLLLQEIQDPIVRAAFSECQQPPQDVWGASELPNLSSSARSLLGAAKLLHSIAYFQENKDQRRHPTTRRSMSMMKLWNEGRDLTKARAGAELPSSVKNCFESNNLLKPNVIDILTKILAAGSRTGK